MTPQPSQSLPRVLGPWMAAAVVVGTVIGSGVFKKARNVAENVPEFGPGILVWVLGGVLALLGALALAEVAVLFPRAGGNYVFLQEAYGRGAGFLWGWTEFWIIRTASIAALATMFTEALHDVLKQTFPPAEGADVVAFWPRQIFTCGVVFGLAGVNVLGTRVGGGLQVFLTAIKVGSLVGIAALPFIVVAVVEAPAHPPTVAYLSPAWPADWAAFDWGKFGAALVAVLWAYHGWMNIAPIAEEVRDPQRNIPRALVGGVALLILLYVSANVAYYLVIPRADLAGLKDTTAATEFCFRLLGPVGVLVASAVVMCSVFGSLNGNILVAPRLLFAMGKDGLAPAGLTRLHPRFATPAAATAVYAAWSCLLVIGVGVLTPGGVSPFDALTDFAMVGAVAMETLAVAAVFVFRVTKRDAPRAYRCWGYPVVPAVYVLIMSAVLANMFGTAEQRSVAVVGMGFIAAGAVVYAARLRGRTGGAA